MWSGCGGRRKLGQGGQRSVRAGERQMTHPAAGFVAGAGGDHFVVGKERGVEQHDIGACQPCRIAGVTAAAPGT